MSLRERLGLKSKQSEAEQPIGEQIIDGEQIIEPATGEEKEKLEHECAEYLQDSGRIGNAEFSRFIDNIIHLTGGTKESNGSGSVSKATLSITDDGQNQENVYIQQKPLSIFPSIKSVCTSIQYGGIGKETEIIRTSYTSSSSLREPNNASVLNLASSFSLAPDTTSEIEVNSHLTGEVEKVTLQRQFSPNHVDPLKVKRVAQRIFVSYKQQGRPAQPPAPQI